ncbi:MAG: hypothetical protein CMH26_07565 [Micavibrio sp.]|nr:hypothetical protein [Micavibrio sp.]|tara:strand:- start:1235 stop:2197 length:963 start_codon:yes stop_codon:yes gene_type:complete
MTHLIQSQKRHHPFIILIMACLIFIAFLGASEVLLRQVVIPQDNFYKQLSLYETLDQDINIVAFGDSRMSQGFAPLESDHALNLAMAGESFEQMADKIDAFFTQYHADNVIIQLEHHMFSNYRFDGQRRDYKDFFISRSDYHSFLETHLALQDPVLRGKLLKYWKSYISNGFKLNNNSQYNDKTGHVYIDYEMLFPPDDEQKFHIKNRIKEHRLPENYKERSTWARIRSTISALKDKGLGVCLVSYPVTPLYSEQIIKQNFVLDAKDEIAALALDLDVPYFMDWHIYDKRYELFRNHDHLNKDGAALYTRHLLSECGFKS